MPLSSTFAKAARAFSPSRQLFALLMLGLLAGGMQVRAQSVGQNLNLSQAAGNQSEPAVAIDPVDSRQIFMASRNEVGGLYTARSSDGGTTWTRRLIATTTVPVPGDVPRAYGNPSVAWDSFGNLFLVYLEQSSPLSTVMYVTLAVSTDGGATFHSPSGSGPALVLPYNVCPCLTGDQPTVAVGPGSGGFPSSVWVTYFSYGGIWISGAGVSGTGMIGSFASQPLPSQPVGVSFGDLAVGPNGEVMVTYGPDSGTSGIVYTDVDVDGLGPGTFSGYRVAAPVNLGGFTYIPAQPHWGIDPEAGLAFDRSGGPHRGRAYLVYTDASAVGSADTDIFVKYSDDYGSHWSTPLRINDDTGTNSQFLPRIALDQSSGELAVTWYDARNAPANDTAQYFAAFSIDGGQSFGMNFSVSQGVSNQATSIAAQKKTDFGDYSGSAFAGGYLLPMWADNSNSTGDNPDGATNFEIYTAVVQAPAVTPPDFSISAAPATASIMPGEFAIYTITLTPSGGFNDDVTYNVTGLPAGASAAFEGGAMTVTASAQTPVGTYALTITGTSGSLLHTAGVALVVTPGFALKATPPSQSCPRPGRVSYEIAVKRLGGFKGRVTFSAAGLPSGVGARFSPQTSAGGSTLFVSVSRKAVSGTYLLTINGASGALSRSVPVTLTIAN